MKLKIRVLTVAGLAALAAGASPLYRDPSASVAERVDDLLGRMTLREKIGQLTQGRAVDHLLDAAEAECRRGEVGSFINMCRPEVHDADSPLSRDAHDRLQRAAVEGSRLGIPLVFGHDVIHGCYVGFPSPLAQACAFEPELFERTSAVAAREAREAGYEWVFAPMCDVARDPRWGRVIETCGEDPYLNALCAAAQVRGSQGADGDLAAPGRVAACLKHFVGYSEVIGGRDYNQTESSDWSLRNLHLPPFRLGVEAGAATVMSSFNTVDGLPACCSRRMLTDVLRGEWGFKGFVVTDWGAVEWVTNWNCAADLAAASRLSFNAGNDMDMVDHAYITSLEGEVAAGRVSLAAIDESVRRILAVKFRLGLFERPYAVELPAPEVRAAATEAAHALAKECALKCAVLLENDGTLPLKTKKVALVGPAAEDRDQAIGCWSSRALPCRTTLAEELKAALGEGAELSVTAGCAVRTVPKMKTAEDGIHELVDGDSVDNAVDREGVAKAVAAAEAVVLAVAEDFYWTGENHSRATLELTGRQRELVEYVLTLGKPVAVVVFSGRPLDLGYLQGKAAVLNVFQPGCEGPAAIAALLTGAANPEGRLVISFPRSVNCVPVYYNAPQTGRPGSGQYIDVKGAPNVLYPFGYGLSYTTFEFSPTVIRRGADGRLTADATITNTGSRDGVAVPQLYVRQLACEEGIRPLRELRGFCKVALKPGESVELSFVLDAEVLGYTDRAGVRRCDAGAYEAVIAVDSASGRLCPFEFTPAAK